MNPNNTANVSVGKGLKGGYLFSAPVGTPLPTEFDTQPDDLDPAFENLGYITEDGINNAIESDSETFPDMNGDTIESAGSTYTETLVFTLAEQKKSSLAMEYGEANVTDASGMITANHTSDPKEHRSLVALLVLKDGRRQTSVVPDCQVTEVGEKQYTSTELIGRELTATCLPDANGSHIIDYIQSTETETPTARIKAASFKATADEAKAEIKRLTGKTDPYVNSDEVFVFGFDRDLEGRNILIEIEKDGKVYSTTNGTKPLEKGTTVIYFSMKSGSDIDFVDKTKKSEAVDLSDFKGTLKATVYETDSQDGETYPTGLKLVKKRNFIFE